MSRCFVGDQVNLFSKWSRSVSLAPDPYDVNFFFFFMPIPLRRWRPCNGISLHYIYIFDLLSIYLSVICLVFTRLFLPYLLITTLGYGQFVLFILTRTVCIWYPLHQKFTSRQVFTVCPSSLAPIHIVTCYIKRIKTSYSGQTVGKNL